MALTGFTSAEEALLKQTYLVFFSNTMHHTQAIKATVEGMALAPGVFTLKTVSRLRKDDSEFDKAIKDLEAADDLELASMARENIRTMLKWRGKGDECDRAITIWVEKSRGGYTERERAGKKEKPLVHPVDLDKVGKLKVVGDDR